MTAVSVIIPTYNRGETLLRVIERLLVMEPTDKEIIIVDQTRSHAQDVWRVLKKWSEEGKIRYIRLRQPSIPVAINRGLIEARSEIALIIDDDAIPDDQLIQYHLEGYKSYDVSLIAGRIIQPWHEDGKHMKAMARQYDDPDMMEFNSPHRRFVKRFMAGNVSLKISDGLQVGGMDENFVGSAYRFEAEFADRMDRAGMRMLYLPTAQVRHLKLDSGGTSSYGIHYRTIRPYHAVGEYYYLLAARSAAKRIRKFFLRPIRSCVTRYHMCRPWAIVPTLIAEIWAMLWAVVLRFRGPRLVGTEYRK